MDTHRPHRRDTSADRYPFVWYPLAAERHAIDRKDAEEPMGEPARTLCGQLHPRIPVDDLEWLWPTCEPCWEAACRMVGIERRHRAGGGDLRTQTVGGRR